MSKFIVSQVESAQKKWSEYILQIGNAYRKNEDFQEVTNSMLKELYKFSDDGIIFKPTLANKINFRFQLDEVISYFLGNNKDFPEDKGFAIKEWTRIYFHNSKIKQVGNLTISVGLYYFVDQNDTELEVEYTFIYEKIENEGLKIILHHSSIPFSA